MKPEVQMQFLLAAGFVGLAMKAEPKSASDRSSIFNGLHAGAASINLEDEDETVGTTPVGGLSAFQSCLSCRNAGGTKVSLH